MSDSEAFEPHIPSELEEKVYYICNDCKNIWEWSEKVYKFVKRVRREQGRYLCRMRHLQE